MRDETAGKLQRSLLRAIKRRTPLGVKAKARALQAQLRTLGAKYRCPVCDSRVSAFLPLPEYYSENLTKYGWPFSVAEAETCNAADYQCPICYASDRDRLFALYLADYIRALDPTVECRIVDFAPSEPLSNFIRKSMVQLRKRIAYRTADAFAQGVDDQVDIANLTVYADGQFDFFICSHVLEHVPDDRKSLRELHRILRPRGRGILMVPIILSIEEIDEDPNVSDAGERWRRFGQDDHVRLYSKRGFVERIRAAGFTVRECDREYFGARSFAQAGITDRSVLYVVEK